MCRCRRFTGQQPTSPGRDRDRTPRIAAEVLVIFAWVTAAFLVDRGLLAQQKHLRQARDGIIAELDRYEARALEHAEAISESIRR